MRILGILKEEPPVESMFEVLETTNTLNKGEIVYLTDEQFEERVKSGDMYAPYYKKIGTFRQAFVGDMQEKINEAMQRDMIKYYAINHKCYVDHVYHTQTKYVKVSVFYFISEWIKQKLVTFKRKQKEKPDMYLEEQLFGPRL